MRAQPTSLTRLRRQHDAHDFDLHGLLMPHAYAASLSTCFKPSACFADGRDDEALNTRRFGSPEYMPHYGR